MNTNKNNDKVTKTSKGDKSLATQLATRKKKMDR